MRTLYSDHVPRQLSMCPELLLECLSTPRCHGHQSSVNCVCYIAMCRGQRFDERSSQSPTALLQCVLRILQWIAFDLRSSACTTWQAPLNAVNACQLFIADVERLWCAVVADLSFRANDETGAIALYHSSVNADMVGVLWVLITDQSPYTLLRLITVETIATERVLVSPSFYFDVLPPPSQSDRPRVFLNSWRTCLSAPVSDPLRDHQTAVVLAGWQNVCFISFTLLILKLFCRYVNLSSEQTVWTL